MAKRRTIRVNGMWTELRHLLSESPTPPFNPPATPFRGVDDYWGMGRLDPMYYDSVRDAEYWIYSYATPIAWRQKDGTWVVPDEKYSGTTSRHQGRVNVAVHNLNVPA